MTRGLFTILQWRSDDAHSRARGIVNARRIAGLSEAASGSNWVVLIAHGQEMTVAGSDLLIGRLRGRCRASSTSIQAEPASTRARRLIRHTWGSYLAILVDDGLAVMPDPSGAMPAFVLDADGLVIVSDDVSPGLLRAVRLDPVIDQAALAATLVDPACATYLSFVRGVTPLIPGELHVLGQASTEAIWRPSDHVVRPVPDPAEALRDAVDAVTEALIAPDTLLQLSGGLDSAILLTSATTRGHRPLTMNFATQDSAGDERDYARPLADLAGCRLIEIVEAGLPDYRHIANARQGAAPLVFGFDDVFERAIDRLVTEHGASSVMTGQGGDAVFFQPATTLVSIDHARATKFGSAFWHGLPDAARRTHSSIWPHLLAAVCDRFSPAAVPTDLLSATLMTARGLEAALGVDRRHPWSRSIDHLPPAKRLQIVMIANSQIFHAARASGKAPLLHPLLTQPVIETALAIPSFVLVQGDNDRGLARKAFADRLPPALVARRTKGDASEHYSRAILSNLPFLREYLLEGLLVSMGIIDRNALDKLLTPEALFFSLDYRGLAMQVSCEAWARAWIA